MKASDIAIDDVVAVRVSKYDRPLKATVVGFAAKGDSVKELRARPLLADLRIGRKCRYDRFSALLTEGHSIVQIGETLHLAANRHLVHSWAEQERLDAEKQRQAAESARHREAAWAKYEEHRAAIAEAAEAKGFLVLGAYEQNPQTTTFGAHEPPFAGVLRLPTREEHPDRSAPRELHIEPKVLAALLGR